MNEQNSTHSFKTGILLLRFLNTWFVEEARTTLQRSVKRDEHAYVRVPRAKRTIKHSTAPEASLEAIALARELDGWHAMDNNRVKLRSIDNCQLLFN